MADETARTAEQVRRLRNKSLRGVQERNATSTTVPLRHMTPVELIKFRDDLIYLTTVVNVALDQREQQAVRVGAEEKWTGPGGEPDA